MKKTVIVESHIEVEYTDLSKVVEDLHKLYCKHSKNFTNLRLVYEYGYGYSDNKYLVLKGDREETPEEVTKRLNSEQKNKEYRRQQYEELKKEFGE